MEARLSATDRAAAPVHGGDRRQWFQPLLLLGIVFVALPVTMRRVPGDQLRLALSVLGLMAVASLVAWLVANRVTRHSRWLPGWGLVALGVVALWVVGRFAVPEHPEHALPFAAGLAVSVAPVRRWAVRLPIQVLVVAGTARHLVAAGRPGPQVVLVVALLGTVVWLSVVLARSLQEARRAQQQARLAAERRAELLTAVRDLSVRDPGSAAATVARTLRSLGCRATGVALDRGDGLVPTVLDGLPTLSTAAIHASVVGDAVAGNRRLVVAQQPRDPRWLPGAEGFGSLLTVPVRVEGAAVGALFGARREHDLPPESLLEVAEVLAAHLGGVIEAEDRVARQRELLARMEHLERMRAQLIAAVSDEIRDPLTVVRGIARTLELHGDRLPTEQRERLLAGFETQAGALRAVIDTLLDFSRLQAQRPLPTLGRARLGDLLEPVLGQEPVTGASDVWVETDPSLLRRAVELLASEGPGARAHVEVVGTRARVWLELDQAATAGGSRLLAGLAERLVVAAGGRWRQHDGGVELELGLAAGTPAELVGEVR